MRLYQLARKVVLTVREDFHHGRVRARRRRHDQVSGEPGSVADGNADIADDSGCALFVIARRNTAVTAFGNG
jgi:hypothetical protein